MNYISTRGQAPAVTASQAIINGIAPDGGLYVPESWPNIELDWTQLQKQTYADIATLIFDGFFDDFSVNEIDCVIDKAYGKQWTTEDIVSYHQADDLFYIELFHGPTLAFKDVALQALPHLMTTAAKKQGLDDGIVILTATSGDTGTAAMSGFGDVQHTDIVVFYPEVGVSDIQRRQMQTEPAHNAHVTAISGNFDDAQKAVKSLLSDQSLAADLADKHLRFSSANSINIGRLVPQIVYYIHAYAQLVKQHQIASGEAINIVVPTGNFGNMLAAYYASQIGLPVAQFVVASNENNVLTDFFNTGTYDRQRTFKVTNAPAMDILVSSNLERLLYFASGRNTEEVREYMNALDEQGHYTLKPSTQANLSQFKAASASQTEVLKTIKRVFEEENYVIDPHTAVGQYVYNQLDISGTTILAATASPFKFADTVLNALGETPLNEYDGLKQLADKSNVAIPEQIQLLFQRPVIHTQTIAPNQMTTVLRHQIF
ncbi:threonine synthase [Leuconostoc citreum]|uniref:threonine synthase n=1 Tax=Leuconostoc citreum TaxID=33964 RepID=UPI0011BB6495|nr:threonine synthase [Leuconostoc citreum]QEA54997.1 threonine synthase [Leuconostoc citreum]